MALYVIDDRFELDSNHNGNTPINSLGILWKVKSNLCENPLVNENWQSPEKNYSICSTRSNNLIYPVTTNLSSRPNNICSDKFGNLFTHSLIDKKINKIDINNNVTVFFEYPNYLDSGNNSAVGGTANGKSYRTNNDITDIEKN